MPELKTFYNRFFGKVKAENLLEAKKKWVENNGVEFITVAVENAEKIDKATEKLEEETRPKPKHRNRPKPKQKNKNEEI